MTINYPRISVAFTTGRFAYQHSWMDVISSYSMELIIILSIQIVD